MNRLAKKKALATNQGSINRKSQKEIYLFIFNWTLFETQTLNPFTSFFCCD